MRDLRTKYTNIVMAQQKAMKCLTKQETKDILRTFPAGKAYHIKYGLRGIEDPIIIDSFQLTPTQRVLVRAEAIRVNQIGPEEFEIEVLGKAENGATGSYKWVSEKLTDEMRYQIHNALRITMRGI
jgi:hypothetical protein